MVHAREVICDLKDFSAFMVESFLPVSHDYPEFEHTFVFAPGTITIGSKLKSTGQATNSTRLLTMPFTIQEFLEAINGVTEETLEGGNG